MWVATGLVAPPSGAEPFLAEGATLTAGGLPAEGLEDYSLGLGSSSERESGLDIGARHWTGLGDVLSDSVAFGNISRRFELGHGQNVLLFSGADAILESLPFSTPTQARPATNAQQAASQPGVTDDVLEGVRAMLLEHVDGTNISIAGFDVNVQLKGSERSVSLNGFDVLPAMESVMLKEIPVGLADAAEAQAHGPSGTAIMREMLREIEGAATHPMTIFLTAAIVLGYLFVRGWAKFQDVAARGR
jgi:hypothetical protein